MFYIEQCLDCWTTQSTFTLHPLVNLFISTPTRFLWEAFSQAAIMRNYYSHTFHHCLQPGTHLYSSVNWDVVDRTKMPSLRNGSKGKIRTWAISKSGILLLSYCAPHYVLLLIGSARHINCFTNGLILRLVYSRGVHLFHLSIQLIRQTQSCTALILFLSTLHSVQPAVPCRLQYSMCLNFNVLAIVSYFQNIA